MPPLHLHILAPNRTTARRIERALQTAEPDCTTQIVADCPALLQALVRDPDAGGVAVAPAVSPELRHELNNYLGVIRILADILAEAPGRSPLQEAKAREIGTAAEAAAKAIRRAYENSAVAN